MIIISSSLVLTATPSEILELNNPLIGYRTISTVASITASSETSEGPAVNLANPATHLYWQASDETDQTIEISNPDLSEIDYVGIARHNGRSAFSTIWIEGYTDVDGEEEPIWEVLIDEHIPGTGCPLIYRFEKAIYQGIRIHFDNNTVAPRAAVIFCGELLIMQRRLFVGHSPLPLNRQTAILTGVSESGNYLGRVVTNETRQSVASFQNITQGWYRQNIEPFAEVAMDRPFFWAWRPQDYPLEVGFAWLTQDIQPSNQLPNGMMQFELHIRGIGCS